MKDERMDEDRANPKVPKKTFRWDEKDWLTTNECLALSGLTDLQFRRLLKLYRKYGQGKLYEAVTRALCHSSKPDNTDKEIALEFEEILMAPPSTCYSWVHIGEAKKWVARKAEYLVIHILGSDLQYVVDHYRNGKYVKGGKPPYERAGYDGGRSGRTPRYSVKIFGLGSTTDGRSGGFGSG